MKHLTLTIPLKVLGKALGLPDGIEVVAVREGDNDIVNFKMAIPDGILPSGDEDAAFVFEGITERPKCVVKMVPSKGKIVGDGG